MSSEHASTVSRASVPGCEGDEQRKECWNVTISVVHVKLAVTPCPLPVAVSLSLVACGILLVVSHLSFFLAMSLCPCFHSSQANDQYPRGHIIEYQVCSSQ